MADEVGGDRPGGTARGDILDGTKVVPRSSLLGRDVQEVDEFCAEVGQQALETRVEDARSVEPSPERNEQVGEAGGNHLQGEPGRQVIGLKSESSQDATGLEAGAEAGRALVHLHLEGLTGARGANRNASTASQLKRAGEVALRSSEVVEDGASTEEWVTGKRKLLVHGENAGPLRTSAGGEDEDTLKLTQLLRQSLHLPGGEWPRIREDAQPIAGEGPWGEDIGVEEVQHPCGSNPAQHGGFAHSAERQDGGRGAKKHLAAA